LSDKRQSWIHTRRVVVLCVAVLAILAITTRTRGLAQEDTTPEFLISSDPEAIVLRSLLAPRGLMYEDEEFILYGDGRLIRFDKLAPSDDATARSEAWLEYREIEGLVQSVISAGLVDFDWDDYPEHIRRIDPADAPQLILQLHLESFKSARHPEGRALSKTIGVSAPWIVIDRYPDLREVRAMIDIRETLGEYSRRPANPRTKEANR